MKATVLVVDDDPALRRFLTDRLQFLGHHVEAVADGEAALSAAERSRFDLVLLDLSMPKLGGFEVLDRLRAKSNDEEIVVLTAGNTKGVARVDDRLAVDAPEPEPAAVMYTVVSGDTLSGIAKAQYGNAMKYMTIFEANKPMLEDPDKIYPGQVLRIPPLEG